MALTFSTHLRNKMLGGVPVRHVATYTAGTNADIKGASTSTFTDAASLFITKGFTAGDSILSYGFAAGMLGIHGPFIATEVLAGQITVSGTPLAVDAASGVKATLVCLTGGSLKDVFKDGVLKIYSGTRPADADTSIGGATLLVTISVSSATFTAGAVAAGLEFGAASAGAISKLSTEVWSGTAVQTGTAGFFRLYANATDAGAADTTPFLYPRIDGTIATSGADLNMTSTSIRSGATITIDTFTLTLPATA
jgi:hypothetical protein